MSTEKKVLSRKELAGYLGVGQNKAHQLVSDKSFYPAFRLGGRVLVNKDMLDKWLNEQCQPSGGNQSAE